CRGLRSIRAQIVSRLAAARGTGRSLAQQCNLQRGSFALRDLPDDRDCPLDGWCSHPQARMTGAQAMKIRAALTHAKGKPFALEEVTLFAPKSNEVLVRVVATGVCHTDAVARDLGISPYPI